MRKFIIILFLIIVLTPKAYADWTQLQSGLELGKFTAKKPSPVGDSIITILRIDPNLWELVLTGKSSTEESENKTAKDWCNSQGLTAAINAGMFKPDYKTHLGYLSTKGHTNNALVNKYMSVAAFDPKKAKSLPEFRIFDLDVPGVTMKSVLKDYSSAVQNLRLIKKPGENRWPKKNKMWSEAALGEDNLGRILFIFSRSPFTMHDFNVELLSLDIGLVAAQHLEGGPEAQLYLQTDNMTLEMFGSYETDFQENDENAYSWPVPNILGLRQKNKSSN